MEDASSPPSLAASGKGVPGARPAWKTALLFVALAGVVVSANWARTADLRAIFLCCPDGLTAFEVEGRVVRETATVLCVVDGEGVEHTIDRATVRSVTPRDTGSLSERVYRMRWTLVPAFGCAFALMAWRWTTRFEVSAWIEGTWSLARQILPLLLIGVFAVGLLVGGPDGDGLIPGAWIAAGVGGESLGANALAAVAGVVLWLATLTEIPLLESLRAAGMGQGPALALLLAGPAVSLPSLLVVRSVIGTRRTIVFVALVVVLSTVAGVAWSACGEAVGELIGGVAG